MIARLEWLFARPWRLTLLVSLFVALPVLVIGQVAANDTRARVRAAHLEAVSRSADLALAEVSGRITRVRDGLDAVADNPSTASALVRRDEAALQAIVADLRQSLTRESVRVYAALPDTPGDYRVVASAPRDGDLVGRRLAELPRLVERGSWITDIAGRGCFFFALRAAGCQAQYTTPYRRDVPGGPAAISIVRTVSLEALRAANLSPGVLVAEVDLTRVAEAMNAFIGPEDDAYLVDQSGRLVGRAVSPEKDAFRDLSADPSLSAALSGGVVRGEADDPLGGGRRLAAVASKVASYGNAELVLDVIVVRPIGVVERDLGPALGQLDAARIGLVLLLVGGSYLFASVASRALTQRRELASALERNVQLVADIREKGRQLEEASQAKSQFLANMSHELRTPLNAIIGFSEVLSELMFGELNARQTEYVKDINNAGRHLLTLINDVLDLSKVEAGKMELRPEDFDLADALGAVHAVVRPLAEKKGIVLALQLNGGVWLRQDPARFRQILLNLLSNAVKFTAEGGRVTTAATYRGDGQVEIAVTDTGVGIRGEDLPHLFEEFRQLDAGARQEGTGLGLALVRRLALLMGGDVSVASEVGHGSTFTLRLPLRQPELSVEL